MSAKVRQVLAFITALMLAAGVGTLIHFLSGRSDLYKAAAERIDAEFGEYIDVTYIGKPPETPEALVVVVVQKKLFESSTDPLFVAFDDLLSKEIRALINDEVEVDLYILNEDLDGGYVVGFDAQGLKNGKTLNETVMASTSISGTPEPEFLVWMDK